MTDTTLADVHKVFKENLYIEDTNRIDIVLAIALSPKQRGIPVWMIMIGSSGDMKSAQLNALMDLDYTYVLHGITSKTLVNGCKDKKTFPDLAPELDNKLVLIPDMAQILEMHPQQKGELWGQLRDLFDGFAGKSSGQGSNAKYKDLYVSLLAGSTNKIDTQILIFQDLGTRELCYRTSGNINPDKLMDKCFDNIEREAIIKRKLSEVTTKFLKKLKIRDIEVTPEVLSTIKKHVSFVRHMRAPGEFDRFSHDLINPVSPEQPSRVAKQLLRIYKLLMNLDENYPSEKALKIVEHVARSSSIPLRVRIYDYLMSNLGKELSTSTISHHLNIGKGSVKMQCLAMESMGILKCSRTEIANRFDVFEEKWSINPFHELHKDSINPPGAEE